MSLFNKAYETYEYHKSLVGMIEAGKSPLLPISHILKNVQIEASINLNGEFVSAVDHYMQEHTSETYAQLLENNDYKRFLR